MKKLMIILTLGITTACGTAEVSEDEANEEVTTETTEKLKSAQDENIELEEIDGELDSLLNSLN